MLEPTQIRQILAKILESPEFHNSQKYRELLQFLVEESIAGRQPKETTIAVQIFGKEASFNSKEDATVRVYMNNLRKKLEHYYFTSSEPHEFRLSIPVGHYRVELVPFDLKIPKPFLKSHARSIMVGSAIVVAFGLGYVVHALQQSAPAEHRAPDPIWHEFQSSNGRHTLIVIGDYFFLRERTDRAGYYRRPSINSTEDYQLFSGREPDLGKTFQVNDFTFLRPSGPWSMAKILPIIQENPSGYSLKLASEFTSADFKGNNIIFIGTMKTLHSFRKFLHMFRMERTTARLGTPEQYESIAIRNEAGDSVQTFSIGGPRSGDYVKDFSFIAKGHGPDGCTILMILGFTENGVIAGGNAACDPALFDSVAAAYPLPPLSEPFGFTLVLGTEGISQAIFSTHIRHFLLHKGVSLVTSASSSDSLNLR